MESEFVDADYELLNSDEEFQDDDCADKLVDAIASLDDKKKSITRRQRGEVSKEPSDFHVPLGTSKIQLSQLLGSLSEPSKSIPIKQLNRVTQSTSVVATPLHKAEQDRVSRSVAYHETKVEVAKWDPVVDKNRKAEALHFPLQKPDFRLITTGKFVKRFTPHTALELEVAALLEQEGNNTQGKGGLTQAEERAFKAMSLEEARERRAELQRHRALLSQKEVKARRVKKIKSKKYHRIRRKEKVRSDQQALEELEKRDPQAFLEKMVDRDRDRIQERMSLKHRGASKKMKKNAIYGKFDDAAKEKVQEMTAKNRELTQKVVQEESEEEEEESDEDEDEETQAANKISQNPWMSVAPRRVLKTPQTPMEDDASDDESDAAGSDAVQESQDVATLLHEQPECNAVDVTADVVPTPTSKPKQKKRKRGDVTKDVNIDEIFDNLKKQKTATLREELDKERGNKGRKKPNRSNKKERRSKAAPIDQESESDNDEDSDEEISDSEEENDAAVVVYDHSNATSESLIAASTKRKRTLEDYEGEFSDADEADRATKRQNMKQPTRKQPMRKEHVIREITVDPEKLMTMEETDLKSKSSAPDMIEEEEDEDGVEEAAADTKGKQQRMTIAAAFADDDVVEEFEEEKKKKVDEQKPKDIDMTIPGWGNWGGENISISKKNRKRFTIKAPPAPLRKDSLLHNVIISEKKDNSIAKYQVSELPYCFTNIHQFEYTIKQPIGRTWNSETAYRKMIQPEVSTMMGTIIDPINKKDTFKHMSKKRVEETTDKEGGGGKRPVPQKAKNRGGKQQKRKRT